MAILTPIFDPKWALVGPKSSQMFRNMSPDVIMISPVNGVFKVNIARKCVFLTLGAVPGDWNFRVLKYWLNLQIIFFCI